MAGLQKGPQVAKTFRSVLKQQLYLVRTTLTIYELL